MDLNIPGDDNVGSARDNSTGGTLSKLNHDGDSSSVEGLISTLVPVLVYVGVALLIFFLLRTRCPRVYSPRTLLKRLLPHQKSDPLPNGRFAWIKPLLRLPDSYVLNHASLDAFLFLRYLKVLSALCLVGCVITFSILLPIHARGDVGKTGLDALTIGNISDVGKFTAHVLVAWVFFGIILFTIFRECVYYINLRHAYLLHPFYANRLSSRTVLFTCVPDDYIDAHKLRKIFGDTVRNIWIPRDTKVLGRMVQERDQTAVRLENAEIKLIKMANTARRRHLAHTAPELPSSSSSSGEPVSPDSEKPVMQTLSPRRRPYIETIAPPRTLPDVNGSVAAQWIPTSSRPKHRPLANYLRRVDTIKWCRRRIKALTKQIHKLRRGHRMGDGEHLAVVFIEFTTQAEAQRAHQTLSHHRPLHMSPRYIGIRPDEIVWSSLTLGWTSRIVRRFGVFALITAAIIFWSIPAGFVGAASKIEFLAQTIPLLSWLTKLPKAVLGVISGLLPALALSILMAIVPWLLRGCARMAGVPSLSQIELFVQSAYFAFQVVQVFLVTTLTSAASAAAGQIIDNPLGVKDLLAENLPTAANFYVSYILIQCLAAGAAQLVHVFDLVRHHLIARTTDHPRLLYRLWNRMVPNHWGALFPVFTNMGVIAITYSCISPIVLGFATVGIYAVYLVYKHNMVFTDDMTLDTRGLVYPYALMHLLTGLYIAEICLTGLLALRSAFGQMVMMIVFLILTALVHLSLKGAISPLLYDLPRTLALESEVMFQRDDFAPVDPEAQLPPAEEDSDEEGDEHIVHGARGLDETGALQNLEGLPSFADAVKDFFENYVKKKAKSRCDKWGITPYVGFLTYWLHPDPNSNPNFFLRWLHPNIYDNFYFFRAMIPADLPDPVSTYPEDYADMVYYPPEMYSPPPKIWVPRDDAGVSAQEVEHGRKFCDISDEGACLDAKGRIISNFKEEEPREIVALW